jgi:hypothetical protein
VVESVWFGDAASGNFDLAIGAIVSALLDPSDYFNAWYGKDGPQNYSFWENKEFQALSAKPKQSWNKILHSCPSPGRGFTNFGIIISRVAIHTKASAFTM